MGQYIYIQISLSYEGQEWQTSWLMWLRKEYEKLSWLCLRCSLGTWLNLIKQSKVMERLHTLNNSSLIFVFVVFGEEWGMVLSAYIWIKSLFWSSVQFCPLPFFIILFFYFFILLGLGIKKELTGMFPPVQPYNISSNAVWSGTEM